MLAELLGIREAELGEVDTVLTVQSQSFDESSLLGEAEKRRPDLLAVLPPDTLDKRDRATLSEAGFQIPDPDMAK